MLESLFNKVTGFQASNFIKKRLQHRCFPVKLVKFLRTPFFTAPPVAASEIISFLMYFYMTNLFINESVLKAMYCMPYNIISFLVFLAEILKPPFYSWKGPK